MRRIYVGTYFKKHTYKRISFSHSSQLLHVSRSHCEKGKSCGGGYGLEIPVRYHFLGPAKAIDWLKKNLESVEKELKCNVSKCLK